MKIDAESKKIIMEIPLTQPTGKIRIKNRSCIYDYGLPFASKTHPFEQTNYVEWQISYDSSKDNISTVKKTFMNNKGETKVLYELSEALYYLYKWKIVTEDDFIDLCNFVSNFQEPFIDSHPECKIKRTHPIETIIGGVSFLKMQVEYPQVVYKFGRYEIIAEITVREKQRAVGVQPMLYVCIPITELIYQGDALVGRCAETKEIAGFVIDASNSDIVLEAFKVFSILSSRHHADVFAILDLIKSECEI